MMYEQSVRTAFINSSYFFYGCSSFEVEYVIIIFANFSINFQELLSIAAPILTTIPLKWDLSTILFSKN